MSLPDVVYLDQLADGLAFLGIPLHHFTSITINADAVTLECVVGEVGPSGAVYPSAVDGTWRTVTREIPLRNTREVAA